jgi:O-antigen/teichoic acid export membrane protein
MIRPAHSPARAVRVRAAFALVLALSFVLSFALLSGAALAAAGAASVVASVLALGYAIGASDRVGQRPRRSRDAYSEPAPARY